MKYINCHKIFKIKFKFKKFVAINSHSTIKKELCNTKKL